MNELESKSALLQQASLIGEKTKTEKLSPSLSQLAIDSQGYP